MLKNISINLNFLSNHNMFFLNFLEVDSGILRFDIYCYVICDNDK